MKTAVKVLWAAIVALIVALIAITVYFYADFKLHPEKHAAESAPWYTSPLIFGIIIAAIVVVCVIAIAILRHKLNK